MIGALDPSMSLLIMMGDDSITPAVHMIELVFAQCRASYLG